MREYEKKGGGGDDVERGILALHAVSEVHLDSAAESPVAPAGPPRVVHLRAVGHGAGLSTVAAVQPLWWHGVREIEKEREGDSMKTGDLSLQSESREGPRNR